MREMKTLWDWHDFYLTLDVLLLAYVFEAFRQTMCLSNNLDCLHFPSLPSLTLQLALKVTGVVELMIEAGI